MDYFAGWLTFSWLGILFGLFPGYASTGGILYESVMILKKKPRRWVYKVFFMDAEHPEVALWARGPRRTLKVTWYISIAYVAAILIGAHYLLIEDIVSGIGNIAQIIIFDMSFSVFLLLTWLLPVYFMRRYLKKLKPEDEVDHYTYYDYE